MDERLVGIQLIIRQLEVPNLDELSDRILVQKAIYLLQVLGVDLRFRYSWYIHGPYSRELTECYYELVANPIKEEMLSGLKIRESVQTRINEVKATLSHRPSSLDKGSWLELVASIHYIKHIACPDENISLDNIYDKLKGAGKGQFDPSQVKAAWNELDRLGLANDKRLPLPA